jgi:dGTPase
VKHSRDFGPGEFAALEEYLPGKRPPIEAQIIDLADEIAYNAADLDDGYDAGLVDMRAAAAASPALAALWEEVEGHFPGAGERVRLHEVVRQLMNWMVTSLIEGTSAAAAQLATSEAVREHPSRVVMLGGDATRTTQEIKRFLREHVYESERVASSRVASSGRIATLFDFFLAHPDRLPGIYQEKAADEPLYRVVCDYIAGMTDGFFHRTCRQVGIEDALG